MNFHMAMIGHRFEQPQHMLAGAGVETVNQYRIRSAVIFVSFELDAMRISLLFLGAAAMNSAAAIRCE